jgi:hypothetical protein
MFDMQEADRAASLAWANTGNKIAARMAMIAMTTSNSMSVKPRVRERREERGIAEKTPEKAELLSLDCGGRARV